MSIDVFPATVLNSTLWNGQTYEEGTFTVTATGYTTVVTGTAHYRRIGQAVQIHFPAFNGTSNATTLTLTGLPSSLRPVLNEYFVALMFNNAVNGYGLLFVQASGTIDLYPTVAGGGTPWTNSGLKGMSATAISYPLASALAAPGWTGQSYEEGTFTVTSTGHTVAQTGTLYYVRVGRQVSLTIPANISGTSNATTLTLTGVPLALAPVAFFTQGNPWWIQDNGINAIGRMGPPSSAGVLSIFRDPTPTPFTTSGLKTVGHGTLVYQLI